MRIHLPVVAVAMLLCPQTPARAQAEVPEATTELLLSVNPPPSWLSGDAFATSAWVGFARRHAIRANVAIYRHTPGVITGLLDGVFGDGDGPITTGGWSDVGLAWAYFPGRLWSGRFYELGLLGRRTDISTEQMWGDYDFVATRTRTLATRAHVGRSWSFYRHVVVCLAVGASMGYETGRETTARDEYEMPSPRAVSRWVVDGEAFIRLGFAFGL